ncbi:UNVERIFIED_CONTAM: hypothetical protein Sangu_0334100 [Sesamum angustifolium]|uniref:Uncharacterized protein n=1 Tax=Sesamum angustifolium TaxID=2727405 RepID=A0AAW2QQL8_9LAMI
MEIGAARSSRTDFRQTYHEYSYHQSIAQLGNETGAKFEKQTLFSRREMASQGGSVGAFRTRVASLRAAPGMTIELSYYLLSSLNHQREQARCTWPSRMFYSFWYAGCKSELEESVHGRGVKVCVLKSGIRAKCGRRGVGLVTEHQVKRRMALTGGRFHVGLCALLFWHPDNKVHCLHWKLATNFAESRVMRRSL